MMRTLTPVLRKFCLAKHPGRRSKAASVLGAALACLAVGLPLGQASAAPQVVTTIAQIGQPLSMIAGDCLQVRSLLGPGTDPHLYRPTRSDMTALLTADILVHNGAHLEAQFAKPLDQFAKRKPVFELALAVPNAGLMRDSEQVTDPHFWMNPALWAHLLSRLIEDLVGHEQASAMLDPGCAERLQAGAQDYEARLLALDAWTQALFSDLTRERRVLVSSHDAFGYFGQRYDFQVEGIQGLSTDSQASLKRMNDLAELLVTRQVPVAFVESSIDPKSIETLLARAAARGGSVALGDALFSDAMGPAGSPAETYIGMFAHNVRAIVRGFGLQENGAPEVGEQEIGQGGAAQKALYDLDVTAPDFPARLKERLHVDALK